MFNEREALCLLEKWVRKLRISPPWDVALEMVDDPEWRKTGDIKIDCDDRKAIVMLNRANPREQSLEEVLVHELFHLKLYPLDQVTESLITANYEEGTRASEFAYTQICRWSRLWRSWLNAFCWNSVKKNSCRLADVKAVHPSMICLMV